MAARTVPDCETGWTPDGATGSCAALPCRRRPTTQGRGSNRGAGPPHRVQLAEKSATVSPYAVPQTGNKGTGEAAYGRLFSRRLCRRPAQVLGGLEVFSDPIYLPHAGDLVEQ